MIRGYSDYAANERIFLACLRTGIAVVAFGFVIEKFNLALTLTDSSSLTAAGRSLVEKFSGSLSWGAGHAFIVLGILFVVVATFRFVRTARLLDDHKMHSPSVTVDLVLSVPLALLLRRSASTSCLADALV
jgi:putative membrane protein